MSATLRLGKTRGLRRLANDAGHFTMVALDQRPPIVNLIAARRGIAAADVAYADIVAVKRVLVDVLGSSASAMLLDPNYAFPAALAQLPARTGLVVTLEDHRFQDMPGGRLSQSIRDWSVEKIKRAGADGVKVLAWYRPDAAPDVIAHQQRYVQQVGDDCRRFDIPFVFELLVYPFADSAPKAALPLPPRGGMSKVAKQHLLMTAGHTTDYVEAPEKLPQLVLDSVREFAQPKYGVDLFKLESPLPGALLPPRDGSAAMQQAQRCFDDMAAICRQAGVPWVMLSAGVTSAQFLRVMAYACAAGANGFLAGRAIWWDALQHFPDLAACRAALQTLGGQTVADLGALTAQAGHAWQPDYQALGKLQREGDLCAAYA